jgi:hypothetical protein
MAQKKEIYDVIVKMVNGCFTWEDAIEQIRPLCVTLDLLVKIGKFLDKNESLFTGAFRSLSEVNNLNNIDSFKTFLIQNGYNWSQLRTTIKMLKANRITTAHPGDENTSHEDIQNAICACFPDESSLFHTKSIEALQLLQLLAEELKEPLFLRITH